MIRNTLLVIGLFFVFSIAKAQQDPIYSHYVNNEVMVNPAYIGNKGGLEMSGLFRTQWVDFDGAPQTFTGSIHSLIPNKNFAVGISAYNDQIGIDRRSGFNLIYAYHIPLKEKLKLSLGFQGSFFHQNRDINQLDVVQDGDNPFSGQKAFLMNFGGGAYLYGDKFSVGFGVPSMLEGGWFSRNEEFINQTNHYFLTGSYQADIGSVVTLQPTAAMRFVKGAPFQFEGNLNLILYDKVLVGGGYRSDQSAIFMLNYIHNSNNGVRGKRFRIGYGYEMAWREIRGEVGGTHEVFLSFLLSRRNELHVSPRYF